MLSVIIPAYNEEAMLRKAADTIGDLLTYEGIDYDRQLFFGRCVYQTPEADTLVFFKSKKPVEVGRFYQVKITKVKGDDLEGEIVYED